MSRKTIITILAVGLVAIAFFLARSLSNSKRPPRPQPKQQIVTVFTEKVQNSEIPISITSDGNLVAKNRVELYSEVQGIFQNPNRPFKAGVYFQRGAPLLRLNSDEHEANLRAQKSSLQNQIVLFISDLRLDFPESFPQWEAYLRSFSMDEALQDLPEPITEKEKLFVSGRNVYTAWYNVKNLEERLSKYTIRAPFNGVLTEALVNPGTLVRAGQKLGEFIDPRVFELPVTVNASFGDLLQVGKKVDLHNTDYTNRWEGKVVRVSSIIDPSSQKIPVFVELRGKDLREGMFIIADLRVLEEKDAFEINRKLVFDENKVFVVQDSVLAVREIEAVHFKESTVVVKGLADGVEILSRHVPNAHAGMRVNTLEEGSQ